MNTPNDYHVEAQHLNTQINQEQTQALVFYEVGQISAVDPTLNKVKAVIPNWTNDGSTYMETGWIPLLTPVAGNQFGWQLLPFGGASITDLNGMQSDTGQTPSPEQVLVFIVNIRRAYHIVGGMIFNAVDVPPSGYEDKSKVKAAAGEWLQKHSTGNYMYWSNDNSMSIISLTNPAPVVIPTDAPDDLMQSLILGASAVGTNSNINGDLVKMATSNVTITSDATGASATTDSNLSLIAQQTDAEATAVNTSTTQLEALVTTGTQGNANLDLKANSEGATMDNAEFTLEAKTQNIGAANGTINIDAAEIGTGTLDINVKGLTATLNINVDGITNEMNVNVLNGIVNVTTDIVNVDCLEANVTAATSTTLETGTLEATCTTSATVTAPLATVNSPVVTLGNPETAKRLLNDVAAQVYNFHTHTAPDGQTGPPDSLIVPALECINVFGS